MHARIKAEKSLKGNPISFDRASGRSPGDMATPITIGQRRGRTVYSEPEAERGLSILDNDELLDLVSGGRFFEGFPKP